MSNGCVAGSALRNNVVFVGSFYLPVAQECSLQSGSKFKAVAQPRARCISIEKDGEYAGKSAVRSRSPPVVRGSSERDYMAELRGSRSKVENEFPQSTCCVRGRARARGATSKVCLEIAVCRWDYNLLKFRTSSDIYTERSMLSLALSCGLGNGLEVGFYFIEIR